MKETNSLEIKNVLITLILRTRFLIDRRINRQTSEEILSGAGRTDCELEQNECSQFIVFNFF